MFTLSIFVLVLLIGQRLVRGGEPADIRLAKMACGIAKDKDGKWEIENLDLLFPDVKWWDIGSSESQSLLDARNHIAGEVIPATRAAQFNQTWRPLADAKVELMNNLYYAFLMQQGNPNQVGLYELLPRINLSRLKSDLECAALRDELNS
jgi:hypothetical protein